MITKTPPSTTPTKRGTFILLEGIDRCGKTTQVSLLVKHLLSLSLATIAYRFPDRATPIGHLIDGYLKSSSEVDDRSIHLLFSANRWEKAKDLGEVLASGTNVVCDRYAYSGVAFTSAKRVDDEGSEGKGLGLKWCMGPDVGLPAPDCVIFLELGQEDAEKRGGYGGERYEKRDLQIRVRKRFAELKSIDEKEGRVPWHVVDASQSIEEVTTELVKIVEETVEKVTNGKPLRKMWEDGVYDLPQVAGGLVEEKKEN
mmetsp:Transcript_13733/g.28897  ORF Transcript_13733/g.28897 Transcript_13733/m.28897 type:complete len:256 (-) Transcript_13733:162-929(-)|eukprot:CAMPEP_0171338926 /NCGR_PEP_ID=MMETSP0878-20121228/7635_1 /TAXON_ID=67004 /ORGANISM="Thalassiosira weissflogii, Strain CCMP1336" /LENGTH=255 /DNA_ID=CAMNT_0011840767 /DNA_START=34 /DNA_END=801 /DNA_ORIENTATION=-